MIGYEPSRHNFLLLRILDRFLDGEKTGLT